MINLYLYAFKTHLKCQFQYKFSFFATIIGQFVVSFSAFLGLTFMFLQFKEVEGFTYQQVLLSYSIMLMSFAIGECLGKGFDRFPNMISNGEFDRILVRPRNPIYQILLTNMDFSRIGRFLQAVIVLWYALPKASINWTYDKVFTLLLMIVCGSITFLTLYFLGAAVAFFTIESLEVLNIFTDGGYEFGRYPFSVYGKRVLHFLTFIVPLALFQYYPLLYLLEIEKSMFYMFTPLLSLLFSIPSYMIWSYGLNKYKSIGS